MRRGTPAAIEFGAFLFYIRTQKGLTMRQVGEKIGAPAATVSQVEKGQRAVKEPKLVLWANALGLTVTQIRGRWFLCQREPDPPVVRRRGSAIKIPDLEHLIGQLLAPERARVLGYVEAIMEERPNK